MAAYSLIIVPNTPPLPNTPLDAVVISGFTSLAAGSTAATAVVAILPGAGAGATSVLVQTA